MNFNETDFLGKVSNTFIMILMAIMTDDVKRVEHKVSPSVKEKLLQKTEELNKKNLRQMYDEPNVKNIPDIKLLHKSKETNIPLPKCVLPVMVFIL